MTLEPYRSTTPGLFRPLPPARGQGQGGDAEKASQFDFRAVLRGLRRHWWRIASISLALSAVAVAGIYMRIKPVYDASSLLRIEPSAQELFSPAKAATTSSSSDGYVETQVQLLKSSNVLLAAAADSKVSSMPTIRDAINVEDALAEAIEVKILPKSYLIRVTMTSTYGPEAAAIVNAVTDAFLEADAEWSEGMTKVQIQNLTSYQGDLQRQVDAKTKAWMTLAAKGNVNPPAPVAEPGREGDAAANNRPSITFEEYQKSKAQILKINFDLTEAEAHLSTLTSHQSRGAQGAGHSQGMSVEDVEAVVTSTFRADPEVAAVLAKIAAAERKLANVKKLVQSNTDPSLRVARGQLEAQKANYRKLEDSKKGVIRARVLNGDSRTRTDGKPQVDLVQEAADRVGSLKRVRANLEAMLSKIEVANREDSTDAVKVSLIQSDLKQLDEMKMAVSRRLEQLRFESKGQGRVSRISKARPSNKPISDKRTKLMAIAPVGVLALVAGCFTLMELLSGRVTSTNALSARIPVEVFAVPALGVNRRALNAPTPGAVDPNIEMFSHRIDHLRVAILGEADPNGPGRCLMITSATGGEGKTTLAAQFAARCADSGLRTLLIDADLRRAGLGLLLDIPEGPGLSDVLRGDSEAEDLLVDLGWSGGCRFLSAGTPAKNPGRLIQGARFGEMIDRLRRSFDVILIDTPPVLPVPDALILGKKADGAILATRYDQSRMPQVEQASRLVASAGIPVLGVVLNGIRGGAMPYSHDVYNYQSTRTQRVS